MTWGRTRESINLILRVPSCPQNFVLIEVSFGSTRFLWDKFGAIADDNRYSTEEIDKAIYGLQDPSGMRYTLFIPDLPQCVSVNLIDLMLPTQQRPFYLRVVVNESDVFTSRKLKNSQRLDQIQDLKFHISKLPPACKKHNVAVVSCHRSSSSDWKKFIVQ
ncbi:hypothetical protein FF38_05784 [Lucilia cuprina]|uniref:Uncharacterized protein n=1 Tax=Lucilia cuprina TaxID=7375 RepID=A0A0L0C2F3_LUCCU|nr:hypothetical protein FF38_05784 [Lucilia cuprina]